MDIIAKKDKKSDNINRKRKKNISGERLFNIINTSMLSIFLLIIVIPLWNVLVSSFSTGGSLAEGGFRLWPDEFTLENYKTVFRDSTIWKAFAVSIAKTIIGVSTHVFFTAMVAYAMSKKNLLGRKLYSAIGIVTMFFSGGMIPTYLLIKSLGLLNSFWVYIIPALFSYYDMIIIMNFFRDVPDSLEEAAQIDGAGVWHIFLKIILPLSKPALVTIALFNGVSQWNDYMAAKLYITNQSLYPIQMKLYEILVQQQVQTQSMGNLFVMETTSRSVQMATIVIATIPIILVYPFLRTYLVSGMTLGAVKE